MIASISDRGHRDGDPVLRAPRRDAGGLADPTSRTTATRAASLSLFCASSSACGTPRTTQTNFQRNFSTGEVEVVDGVIYHKTEYRERRNHFAYFACSRDARRLRHPAGGLPRAIPRLGSAGRRRARDIRQLDRARLGTDRLPPRASSRWLRARRERSCSSSATRRTRRMPSSTRPDRRPSTRRCVRPVIERYRRPDEVEAAFGRAARPLGRALDVLEVSTPNDARRPDGERLERVPVHGDVQPVPLGVDVRHRDRPRHGVPGLEPGPARVRAHGPRAGAGTASSTSPRPSFRRAAPTTSTSRSRSAATTRSARASTTTRSGSSSPSAAYVKETGDLAVLDEPVPYDNEPGSETPLYEHLPPGARATRLDRLGPHGLPLIGRADWNDCLNLNCFSDDARRVVPDHREPRGRGRRVRVHRRPVRAGGRGARAARRAARSHPTTPRRTGRRAGR